MMTFLKRNQILTVAGRNGNWTDRQTKQMGTSPGEEAEEVICLQLARAVAHVLWMLVLQAAQMHKGISMML